MSIDIDPAGLCAKCREKHEQLEFNADKKLPVEVWELCHDCKVKNGFLKPGINLEGVDSMAKVNRRGRKRKYTRHEESAAPAVEAKPARLDRETKKFIRHLAKSSKKADRLDAKAEKLIDRAQDLRDKAASLRAGKEALIDAVKGLEA